MSERIATEWRAKPNEPTPNVVYEIITLRNERLLEKRAEYARRGIVFEFEPGHKTRNGTNRGVIGCGPFAGLRWPSLRAAAKATGYSTANVCGHCGGRRRLKGQQLFAYAD